MATGVEDEKKALSYVDDWNIRNLSEFLGKAGPKPKERKFVPAEGNSWLSAEFHAGGRHHGHCGRPLAHGTGGVRHRRGKVDFTPEQLAAAEISEQHMIASLKKVLPTLTNASKIAGHPRTTWKR